MQTKRRRVEIRMTERQEKLWRRAAKQEKLTLAQFIRRSMRRVIDA